MTTGKGVKALCVTVHWHPVNCNPVLENDREDVISNIQSITIGPQSIEEVALYM